MNSIKRATHIWECQCECVCSVLTCGCKCTVSVCEGVETKLNNLSCYIHCCVSKSLYAATCEKITLYFFGIYLLTNYIGRSVCTVLYCTVCMSFAYLENHSCHPLYTWHVYWWGPEEVQCSIWSCFDKQFLRNIEKNLIHNVASASAHAANK